MCIKMKKYFILIGLMIFILFLGSCKNLMETNPTYNSEISTSTIDNGNLGIEFKKSAFKENKIDISYPQISNSNSELSNSINEKIKECALSVLNFYSNETDDLSVKINYTLELINNKIVSICFKGMTYTETAAYPKNVFYTINIDAEIGERLYAKDLLETNMSLIEIIKKNARFINNDINKELISEVKKEIQNYDSSDMLTDIRESGLTDNQIYVYLTQDSIGISIPVLHALGDYANFEVNYNYLEQFLKFTIK